MMKRNQIQQWVVRSGAVCLMVGSLVGVQAEAWASRRITFNPPGSGAPRETKGGASRGAIACATTTSRETAQIILLAPQDASVGLTSLERPTFLAYVPPSSATQVIFNLKDAKGKSHYRTLLPIPSQGGVVRISLPNTVAPLVLNQSYEWGVVLLCGNKLRADSPFAIATIQRTQPSDKITRQLTRQTLLDQAAIYGEHGMWYDMVANLALSKQQKPQDKAIAQSWTQILTSVGLTKVASAPLIP